MVFGPLLDAMAARRRGVPMTQVLSEGNRRVATQLPFATKAIFWLTNVPYWCLATELCFGAPPQIAGPRAAHAICAFIVALVSTAFHGAVLFGPLDSLWPVCTR